MLRKILRQHAKRVEKAFKKELGVSSKEVKREFEDSKYPNNLWNRLAMLAGHPELMRKRRNYAKG